MASNFFQLQDDARKNTRYLVFLFVLAVLSLLVLTNLFVAIFPWQWSVTAFNQNGANHNLACLVDTQCSFWQQMNWPRMAVISSIILIVIGLACLYKWLQIRQGGKAIAQMMGGSLVSINSSNLAEQRLLNIVQEMALAANMPVPEVYILKDEPGINAFAAGFSTKDAVVAVTQGALDVFNRDQLQGVIAHEFSHILNGDMRLNMKLIAILHGILFITLVGYMFIRGSSLSSSRNKNALPVLLLGLGLVILGYLGTFFGSLIKAAVSRQREFLADASAVQFTRNPSGIADALKVIGGSAEGSQVDDTHGSEISHFFFGSSSSHLFALFSTHPPLETRIRQIEPRWNGKFIQAKPRDTEQDVQQSSPAPEAKTPLDIDQKRMAAIVMAAGAIAAADKAQQTQRVQQDSIDSKALVLSQMQEPLNAAAIMVCLLANKQSDLTFIKQQWPELYQELEAYLWMDWQGAAFVPIVNKAVPVLRLFSEARYQQFKQILVQLIKADQCIDLYEWSLFQLLCANLDNHYLPKGFNHFKYKKIGQIHDAVSCVLTLMVRSGTPSAADQQQALSKASQVLGFNVEVLNEVSIVDFDAAVKKIALAYPLLKPQVIKALIAAAKADGKIEAIERQCIIAISASIDAPLPDTLLAELEYQAI